MWGKRKNLNTAQTIIPVFALGVGVLIGYLIFHKKEHQATFTTPPAVNVENSFTHINPLSGCMDICGKEFIMRELHWFRHDLDTYIEKIKAKQSDIHVSYYFRDLTNGMWIGINEKDEFSPASLLKLPIMIAAYKEAEKDIGVLGVKILYNAKEFSGVSEEAGVKKIDGEYYSIEELINQMVDYSDNAAALILMKYFGEDKVAAVEKAFNISIPPNATNTTNFVRIKDYASIFRILFNASYLNKAMSERALTLLSHASYKNGIRAGIPDSIEVAHKYGVRDVHDASGKLVEGYQLHHFGIVYYPGKPFLIGIMTRGGTKEQKEQLVRDLTAITFKNIDRQIKTSDTVLSIENH
jgi:beta-lactamase class A